MHYTSKAKKKSWQTQKKKIGKKLSNKKTLQKKKVGKSQKKKKIGKKIGYEKLANKKNWQIKKKKKIGKKLASKFCQLPHFRNLYAVREQVSLVNN